MGGLNVTASKGLESGGKIARGSSTKGSCSVFSVSRQDEFYRNGEKKNKLLHCLIELVMCSERMLHVSELL